MDARLFEVFADGLIPIIARHCAKAVDDVVAPLLERIAELEGRKPESAQLDFSILSQMVAEEVAKIPRASDGKSVTIDDVAPLIVQEITKAVTAIPAPKDGASVTVEDVAPLIETAVVKAVSALPAPKDGEPGAPGEKGAPGKDGASVTVEDVAPLIETAVVKAVSALPAPKDGEPGAPGEKGEPGRDGRDASDIPMLKGFITDEVRTSTRDTLKSVSLRTSDEGRTLVFAADVAGESVESEIKTALPLDCGVWREREYKKGDGASFGGSFFIAQEDTTDKPETSKAWRLAVKRGRDGRDGKPGERGLPGIKGERGESGPRGFGG